jgi:hypothetical protein
MTFERFDSLENVDRQTTEGHLQQFGEQRLQAADDADAQSPRWVDRGVIDVPVGALQKPDDITGPGDFQKVTMLEMEGGYNKLAAMKPAIDSGIGRESDYWRAVDDSRNLQYQEGYQRVYDAFYGGDAIRVDKVGNAYDVINGRHRIWLAHEMGLSSIPVHVNEKV